MYKAGNFKKALKSAVIEEFKDTALDIFAPGMSEAKDIISAGKWLKKGLKKLAKKGTKEVSPNVQKTVDDLKQIEADGGTVKMNKLSEGQEVNMTIDDGKGGKLDLRIENIITLMFPSQNVPNVNITILEGFTKLTTKLRELN